MLQPVKLHVQHAWNIRRLLAHIVNVQLRCAFIIRQPVLARFGFVGMEVRISDRN
jgi:hypothetical protein